MCSKIPYSAGNESLPARWWKIGAGLGLLTKGLRIGKRRGGSCVSAKVAGKRARPAPTSPRARPALTRPSMTARSDAWGSPTGVDLAVEPKFNVPRVAEDGGGCKHQPTGRNNILSASVGAGLAGRQRWLACEQDPPLQAREQDPPIHDREIRRLGITHGR